MLGPKCVHDLPIYNQAENPIINGIRLQDKTCKICEYWHLQKDPQKQLKDDFSSFIYHTDENVLHGHKLSFSQKKPFNNITGNRYTGI